MLEADASYCRQSENTWRRKIEKEELNQLPHLYFIVTRLAISAFTQFFVFFFPSKPDKLFQSLKLTRIYKKCIWNKSLVLIADIIRSGGSQCTHQGSGTQNFWICEVLQLAATFWLSEFSRGFSVYIIFSTIYISSSITSLSHCWTRRKFLLVFVAFLDRHKHNHSNRTFSLTNLVTNSVKCHHLI